MRRVVPLIVAALLVTALFAPVAAAGHAPTDGPTEPVGEASIDSTADAPIERTADATIERTADADVQRASDNHSTDPTEEPIGCWQGVCHDDELDFDQAVGLTDEQLLELVHLKMARVEYIRDRKFREEVPVETMNREEYTRMVEEQESDEEFNRWNDQVWNALFIVGTDESSESEIGSVFTGAVAGFYSPAENRIVIVVPQGEEVRIAPATLLHELGHAMQDQHHNLSEPRFQGETQDADLAVDGIVEGEVGYMEEVYERRCADGEWECIDAPPESGDDTPPEVNWGILLTVFHPYSDGPAYAADIVEEEGWEGVDERMENPPTSTSQVIHQDDDYETADVAFEDTAENGWETYPDQGVNGADTVGEASIFSMFWYQNREYGAATFDWQSVLLDTSHPYEEYNYAHEASDGWAGDELYPYRNDAGGEERNGYVWVTEWQTEEDAEQFHETYLRMIDTHDAALREDGVYRIEDGDFRGAYGIERDGTTVTIARAPEPDDVFDLRPNIDLEEPEADETTPTEASDDGGTDDGETPTATETIDETPGFGVVVALVALLVGTVLLRRSR